MNRCASIFFSGLIFFLFSENLLALTPPPAVTAQQMREQVQANDNDSLRANDNDSLRAKLRKLSEKQRENKTSHFIFDLPVTYNQKVSQWIHFFQTRGAKWFRGWLEKSYRYLPYIQNELKRNGLPSDLAYMVMIESGFSASAVSHADAVGPWQFIEATGKNYGLKQNWWLDERRDLRKATGAAIRYLKDLYAEFGSWYLVAASYNMGEGGLRRRIQKYKTSDYWTLVKLGALPQETQDYVPKILAAMLISKAPSLYGFRELSKSDPLNVDIFKAPGGTDLEKLADHMGLTRKALKDLNAELLLGYVPKQVEGHYIRVPKGSLQLVRQFLNDKNQKQIMN